MWVEYLDEEYVEEGMEVEHLDEQYLEDIEKISETGAAEVVQQK